MVDGRKIAGLGIFRDPSGGLLFHASLLVDLDVALMSRVLQMPFDEIAPRELAIIARRTTTVRECSAESVGVAEVRASIAQGFESAFGARLVPSELDSDEVAAARALGTEKYEMSVK